jgi:hypothetical protein
MQAIGELLDATTAHQMGAGRNHSKATSAATAASMCVRKLLSERAACAIPASAKRRRSVKGRFFIGA